MNDVPDDPFVNNDREQVMSLLLSIRAKGVVSPQILSVFESISRRVFLDNAPIEAMPEPDEAVAIPCGQIQPSAILIARLVNALQLEPNMKVLEVGTGTGYQTSILAKLCRRVYTAERFLPLYRDAEARFLELGLSNIVASHADGQHGWPQNEAGPFHRIVVNCALTEVSDMLFEQLEPTGMLIAPMLRHDGLCDLVLYHGDGKGDFETKVIAVARYLSVIKGLSAKV